MSKETTRPQDFDFKYLDILFLMNEAQHVQPQKSHAEIIAEYVANQQKEL